MIALTKILMAEPEVQAALVGSAMATVCWSGLTFIKLAKSHLEMWILTRKNGKNGNGNGNGNGNSKIPGKLVVCDFHAELCQDVKETVKVGAETRIDVAKISADVDWIKDNLKDGQINFRALYKKIDTINRG